MNTEQAFIKDNELLQALASGSTKAFQEVYADCFPLVTRSIQNMSGQQSEAEDIFHAALLVLYSKAKDENFRLTCKLSTFLVAVARRKWLKELERKKRLTAKEQNYALLHANKKVEAGVDWDKINENEEKRNNLQAALKNLGSPCKELIEAYYINDLSMKDIADKFDYTNANNAKTQKHKCLQRLKKLFFKEQ